MLLRFETTNYRSFREPTTLSLIASKLQGSNGSIRSLEPWKENALTSAAIFGPNASGKSNVLQAIAAMRSFVENSVSEDSQRDIFWDRDLNEEAFDPHKLSPPNTPTSFEIEFTSDSNRFVYSFAVDHKGVVAETLSSVAPSGRRRKWFKRERKNDVHFYTYGEHFKERQRRRYESLTRPDALYLTAASQFNSTALRPVFDWILSQLRVVYHDSSGPSAKYYERNSRLVDITRRLLQAADFGVIDMIVGKHDSQLYVPKELTGDERLQYVERINSVLEAHVQFKHLTEDNKSFTLPLVQESEGTQSFYRLAHKFVHALEQGCVLIIDELESSLHPTVARYLVSLFNTPRFNRRNAQLIFTTHDFSLLSGDLLRRDQAWIVEKDRMLESHLFCLSEFGIRESDDMARFYITGRYGGVPVVDEYYDFGLNHNLGDLENPHDA